ncbi:MAG TPA: DNA polymerase Y family protein [Terriglobales bacterium]|nr:DNA polymerase Y family protein [Terriglobales bacterium]
MLFACIFVPDFPAEAIIRSEPELRGQPVVVIEGTPPTLNVAAANDHARALGVESGMTSLQAAARVTGAAGKSRTGVIRRRSLAQENSAQSALGDCASAFSPRVQQCEVDTVLLDLEGLERLFGPPQKIARELARRASDVGLEVNVAVSANLDAAMCAARGFSGITVIPDGKEADRLAPLPIDVLLLAAARDRAPQMLETLDRWGIRTFRAFAALPEIAISERLGAEGVFLQQIARGEGSRTLSPADSPLRFEEALELEYPIDDLEALAFVLNRLLEQLCARLSARSLSTNELRLQMQLEPCGEITIASRDDCNTENGTSTIRNVPHRGKASIQKRFVIPSGAAPRDEVEGPAFQSSNHPLIKSSNLRLPVPMLDAKTFLRLFQLELRSDPPTGPVAKIWLTAEPVHPRYAQGGLFLPSAPEPERLELTLARLAGVVREQDDSLQSTRAPQTNAPRKTRSEHSAFNTGSRTERGTHTVLSDGVPRRNALPKGQRAESGDHATSHARSSNHPSDGLRVGSPEIIDTHRPGAFRMKRFVPPAPSSRKREQHPTTAFENAARQIGLTALRLFRPPLPICAEVHDGRPVRISIAGRRLTAAHRKKSSPATPAISAALTGPVTSSAGPWRTSGEWWNEPWSHDEWDVVIDTDNGRVLCRIYRDVEDDSWFVEGTYD